MAGVKDVIKGHEGFRTHAYWDVNHWRVGYGSDTYVDENGDVRVVTKDTVITQEQADADLNRRIPEFQQQGIVAYVGKEAWDKLSDSAKAAVTSVAYNYGSIRELNTLKNAIISGDMSQVADAIEGYGSHNGGINRKRRKEEADLIRAEINGVVPAAAAASVTGAPDLAKAIQPVMSGKTPPTPMSSIQGDIARTKAATLSLPPPPRPDPRAKASTQSKETQRVIYNSKPEGVGIMPTMGGVKGFAEGKMGSQAEKLGIPKPPAQLPILALPSNALVTPKSDGKSAKQNVAQQQAEQLSQPKQSAKTNVKIDLEAQRAALVAAGNQGKQSKPNPKQSTVAQLPDLGVKPKPGQSIIERDPPKNPINLMPSGTLKIDGLGIAGTVALPEGVRPNIPQMPDLDSIVPTLPSGSQANAKNTIKANKPTATVKPVQTTQTVQPVSASAKAKVATDKATAKAVMNREKIAPVFSAYKEDLKDGKIPNAQLPAIDGKPDAVPPGISPNQVAPDAFGINQVVEVVSNLFDFGGGKTKGGGLGTGLMGTGVGSSNSSAVTSKVAAMKKANPGMSSADAYDATNAAAKQNAINNAKNPTQAANLNKNLNMTN